MIRIGQKMKSAFHALLGMGVSQPAAALPFLMGNTEPAVGRPPALFSRTKRDTSIPRPKRRRTTHHGRMRLFKSMGGTFR